MATKLNSIQNMFFNNNPSGLNLPNNNNIFSNQPNNNGVAVDIGSSDYYDLNNPNYQNNFNNNNNNNNNKNFINNNNHNNNNNNNPPFIENSNFNQNSNHMNQEMNFNMNQANNQIPNGNHAANNFNNNNNPLNGENLKKKLLMEGIQQQIQNNKNSKLQELIKKKMEDQKYLTDMNTYNPFGRNGAGAPLRDNDGKVITVRRALISDNKKLNDSSGNIRDDSANAGHSSGRNLNLNNLITNLTQKISAYGTQNIGVNSVPRFNSARVPVNIFDLYFLIFIKSSFI
jgi:hypothetical protein